MIAPFTVYLHSAMAILCIGSLIYLFNKKTETNNSATHGYFYFFLFFLLYNLALVSPLLYFKELTLSTGWFYNIAILFLALASWNAFKLAFNLLPINKSYKAIVSNLYLIGVIIAVVLHFIFPESPVVSLDGTLVFWYSNQAISYIFILFMFIGGWQFAYTLFTGFFITKSYFLKVRSLFISLGAFILPFAAFYYFGATRLAHIYLAFFFSIVALVFILIGNLIGLWRKNTVA